MKNALLVPCVFFLNFFFALLFFSFFGGLALRYSMTVPEANTGTLLLLCIIKQACYVLPAAASMGIIAVYNFLMRHRSKIAVAVLLFTVCLLVTLVAIIPVCYAQIASSRELINGYAIQPATDTVLIDFLNKPVFLTGLIRDIEILFEDLYNAYAAGFFNYFILAAAFFVYICSVWIACIATRWKMINLLFLFLFTRALLFLYPYVHHEVFQSILNNLTVQTEYFNWDAPLFLMIIGLILHIYGGLKLLLLSLKKEKRRAV